MKTAVSIILSGALIAFIIFILRTPVEAVKDNVRMDGDTQIVTIKAKGSYTPQTTIAKAGVPTKLRVNTNGTYDCSAALRIPKYNVDMTLAPTGSTEIDLGTPGVGKVEGGCSMGMYAFEIRFE